MVEVTDRVADTHRHVSRGFSVTAFDPTRDRLPSTRWVSYKARGGHRFEFIPVRLPSGRYRAYIHSQPSYGGRPASASQVHRLVDAHGTYICWSPEPSDVEGLVKVMRVWAEATAGYLRTGVFAPLKES